MHPQHSIDFKLPTELSGNKSEAIYRDLLQKISDGILAPGAKLPSAIDLAAKYGVAKMTLRRALTRLTDDGLIESRPYHGTQVCNFQARRRPKVIGLILPAPLSNVSHPVFSRLVKGLTSATVEAGYTLALELSDPGNPAQEEILLARIRKDDVAGWLIGTLISPDVQRLLSSLRPPVVLFHQEIPSITDQTYIMDHALRENLLMEHTFSQGYRRPCLIYNNLWDMTPFLDRYRDFHKAKGANADPISLRQNSLTGEALGRAVCTEMLASPKPPDIYICEDDDTAFGVMRVLAAHGIKPPTVGVIGAGDYAGGMLTDPTLTTLKLPYHQAGREAGRLLMDLIDDYATDAMTRKFSVELIVRGSSLRKRPRRTQNIGNI